jgi:hypothetical protein
VPSGEGCGTVCRPLLNFPPFGPTRPTRQDWMRLLRARGAQPVPRRITSAELAKHCTRGDAWMAINGRVFDVTEYMEFHPGGVPELLRGAGKDATALFNSIHAWYVGGSARVLFTQPCGGSPSVERGLGEGALRKSERGGAAVVGPDHSSRSTHSSPH